MTHANTHANSYDISSREDIDIISIMKKKIQSVNAMLQISKYPKYTYVHTI